MRLHSPPKIMALGGVLLLITGVASGPHSRLPLIPGHRNRRQDLWQNGCQLSWSRSSGRQRSYGDMPILSKASLETRKSAGKAMHTTWIRSRSISMPWVGTPQSYNVIRHGVLPWQQQAAHRFSYHATPPIQSKGDARLVAGTCARGFSGLSGLPQLAAAVSRDNHSSQSFSTTL